MADAGASDGGPAQHCGLAATRSHISGSIPAARVRATTPTSFTQNPSSCNLPARARLYRQHPRSTRAPLPASHYQLAESELPMSEPSADKRPAVVAAAPEPAVEATGQEATAGQPDVGRGREGPLATMMVDRKPARHKAPARRVPGSILTVTLLAVAVFAVAAVYLVIPKSSGSRSAATAPVSGATSTSAANGGNTTTTTGGQHGRSSSPPGAPARQHAQQGVPVTA